ncbi:MAG: hypothetical protein WBP79_06485 [Candidatus Acidiferrales bacterium]
MVKLSRFTTRCKMLTIACVALNLFQVAAPVPTLGNSGQAAEKAARYDGETVFRGLYFGQGPVAQKLPEIWKQERYIERRKQLSPADERRINEIQDKIVADIKANHKEFLEHFGRVLQSGDHVAIQKELNEATSLAFAALRKETGKDPLAPVGDAASVYRFVEVYVYIWFVTYFYVYEWVAVVIYFSPILEASVEGIGSMKGLTRLQKEEWINLVATRLAAKD